MLVGWLTSTLPSAKQHCWATAMYVPCHFGGCRIPVEGTMPLGRSLRRMLRLCEQDKVQKADKVKGRFWF